MDEASEPRADRPGTRTDQGAAGLEELAAEAVYGALGSGPGGLTTAEAAARLARAGANRIEETRGPGLLRALVGNLTHVMAVLLWIGGGLAFLAELPQLAIAVWTVNLVNGAFSTWQEHRAERAGRGPPGPAPRRRPHPPRRGGGGGRGGGARRR